MDRSEDAQPVRTRADPGEVRPPAGARAERNLPAAVWLPPYWMSDLAWFVLFAVGWLVLQRVVLPRLGVPT